MHIALVSTCSLATPPKAYGGTELVLAELAKGLQQLGHQVTVFATGDSAPEATLQFHFEQAVWPPNELAEMRHASFAWRDIARAEPRFDVVHVNHSASLPFQALTSLPTVLTIHHARVDELVAFYRAYPDVAYVAISNRQAELVPELACARMIHHGLDPSAYTAGHGGGGYVAFLGRFASEKAPHLAIDAASLAGVPIRLGGAPHGDAMDYFTREVRPRLGLRNVTWCGELGHASKIELLCGAQALLVPIQWEEPFGLVMIEAMLVGTPVLAFAQGSAQELVEEGITGYLVRDAEEMATRILHVTRIDRARCRARAQERWSHLRMAREYSDLYRQLPSARDRHHAAAPTFHRAQGTRVRERASRGKRSAYAHVDRKRQ